MRLIFKNSISLQNEFRNIISNKMKIQFLVISLGFIFSLYAQNMPSKNNLTIEPIASAFTQEGKKVFVGNILPDNDVVVSLCNQNNEVIWSVPVKTNKVEKATSMTVATNGDIVVAGSVSAGEQTTTDAWAACISAAGKIKWAKIWGMERQTKITDIITTSDGNYCVVGYTNNQLTKNDAWAAKIGTNGSEIWTKTFGWDKTDEFWTCKERQNGNILLAGFTDSKGAGLRDMLLLEIDIEGAVSWLRVYGKANSNEEATAVVEMPDKQILLAGKTNERNAPKTETDGRILRLDETGKMIWTDIQGGLKSDTYRSIACNENSFVIVGNTTPDNALNAQAWAVSYDYTGTKLWENKWETYSTANHITATTTGWCVSVSAANKQTSGALLSLDEKGGLKNELNASFLVTKEKEVVANVDKQPTTSEKTTSPENKNTVASTEVPQEPEKKNNLTPTKSPKIANNDEMSAEELTALVHQMDNDTSDNEVESEMLALTSDKMSKNITGNNKNEVTDNQAGTLVVLKELAPLPEKEKEAVVVAEKTDEEALTENTTTSEQGAETGTKVMIQNVYVLGVGISSYKNKKYNIRYAASDAELFALSMTGMEGNGFGKVNVQIYTNEQAIRDNIQNAIRNIASQAHDNDLICIYLAGRGYYNNEGIPYLMMNDESEGTNSNDWTSLNLYTLVDSLQKIKGEKVLMTDFFVDPSSEFETIKWSKQTNGNHLHVLTSISEDEIALEKTEWGHSAFSKNLLEGLGGKADLDKNYFIYFSELMKYLDTELPSLTNDLQHPQVILSSPKDVMLGVYKD